MRVGQLIANNDQGSLAPGGSFLQNIVDGGILMGGSQSDDALVRACLDGYRRITGKE